MVSDDELLTIATIGSLRKETDLGIETSPLHDSTWIVSLQFVSLNWMAFLPGAIESLNCVRLWNSKQGQVGIHSRFYEIHSLLS